MMMAQSQQEGEQRLPPDIRRIEIYCRGCEQEIRFDKNHRTPKGKWIPLNMDLSHHQCPAKKQQPNQQRPVQQQNDDLSKEVAAIKAQLQVLVMKLDSLEKELKK